MREHGGHVLDERHDRGRQIELAIERFRGVEVRLARLMHDVPVAQLPANLVHRPGHVFVQRSGAAAAAEHQELGNGGERKAERGRRSGDGDVVFPHLFPLPLPLLLSCRIVDIVSRVLRSNPNRIGFPVTRTGQWQRRPAAVSSKAVQISVARRASQRVALPGTAFCSSSTSGTSRRVAARAIGTLTYPPNPTTAATAPRAETGLAAR